MDPAFYFISCGCSYKVSVDQRRLVLLRILMYSAETKMRDKTAIMSYPKPFLFILNVGAWRLLVINK